MKKILFVLFSPLLAATGLLAHGDEVSTGGKSATTGYFSIENVSDKYELLLKYVHIHIGEPTELTLFVSDVNTNRPVGALEIKVQSTRDGAQVFEVIPGESGIYRLKTTFTAAQPTDLNITIKGGLGADLIQLRAIEPGKELPGDHPVAAPEKASGAWTVLGMLLAFLAGVMLTLLIARHRPKAAAATLVAFLLSGFPFENLPDALAHGDEDHGAKGNNWGAEILMPKETQFLFDVTIGRAGVDAFAPAITLFGTIVPGDKGKAVIQSPFAGVLRAVRVKVGEQVRAGQVVAVVEQSVDAGTSINWQSDRNGVTAEVTAAQKEFDRLNNLSDIIARRDLDEATARLQRAKENQDLFNRLYNDRGGKNARFIPLTAPISSRLEPFNRAQGATIAAGEPLFTLLNPAKVIVEAQMYDKDARFLDGAQHFQIECSNNEHQSRAVRLLALPNSINPSNQSQKVLFEVDNPNGDFKIGEFVNIKIYQQTAQRQLTIPNSAITEISGMPAIFIKQSAEHYTVSYLKTGDDNGISTVILKGLEDGQRYVMTGTYHFAVAIYYGNARPQWADFGGSAVFKTVNF